MNLTTIEHSAGQVTVVNTDQITYLREDNYGTAIHFSSGEHIICPLEVEALLAKLSQPSNEAMLIKAG
jgi:hypothetical protein